MVKFAKQLIAEYSGISIDCIRGDLHLRDDLHLSDDEIYGILDETENVFGIEFDYYDTDFAYVGDLISFVKNNF